MPENNSERNIDHLIKRGNDLMVSVSGIRGRIPAGLDVNNIVEFMRAFCAVTGKKIVIGNDARPTGPIIRNLSIGVLLAAGKEVIDIGLAPTPTVKAAVALKKAHAGIMFSASHNPPEWNAFKFMGPKGFFFDQTASDKLLEAMRQNEFPAVDYKKMGQVNEADGIQEHIDTVLKIIPNKAQIRKKKYRVLVDGVAGAGREALPRLLEELGCKVVRLYCDPTPKGDFPRPPEPTPKALKEFSKALKAGKGSGKLAVGFALDPDADRLVLGSPARGAINEEYTLPLALLGTEEYRRAKKSSEAKAKQSKRGGPIIVVNLSTANLIDQVAVPVGLRVIRSAVGEANVVAKMLGTKAVYGGEGNGGVIHPRVPSFGRDTLSGAALLLSAMAERNARSLDDLMEDMPPLYMEKTKQSLDQSSPAEVFARMEAGFNNAQVDKTDGLHLSMDNGAWVHVRASNTEPILRLIAQGNSPAELKNLLKRAVELM